jgi:transcriptional regulator with XRE-family HTH domain
MDNQLLDLLKERLGFRTDTELAGYLAVTKMFISAVRSGKSPLGVVQRLKILDHLGYLRIANWIKELTSERLAARINEEIQNRALRMALPDVAAANEDPSVDATLLKLAKLLFDCSTDEELSRELGIKPNSLSTIRKGKTGFGPLPRMKILKRLPNFFVTEDGQTVEVDLDEFEEALQSSEKCIELVRKYLDQISEKPNS